MSSNQNNSYKMGGGSNYIRQRERILSRVKVTGEGAVDVSTIKNQYFYFLFFLFSIQWLKFHRMINLQETKSFLIRQVDN
jgi:hypothetical protein